LRQKAFRRAWRAVRGGREGGRYLTNRQAVFGRLQTQFSKRTRQYGPRRQA
jgi:hypothetical protein